MGVVSRRKECIKENKIKNTYTGIFLWPMLGYDRYFIPTGCLIEYYLIDSLQPKIVICLNNKDSEEFKSCVQAFEEDNNFHSMDYDDHNDEVVISMNIPKHFKEDFHNFKMGRYSKFSNEYKELLLDYHGRKSGNGKYLTMIDALFPNHQGRTFRANSIGCSINDLPNGEVMEILDFDRELYIKTEDFINKYKEICKR